MSETVTLIVLCRVCGKEFTLAVTHGRAVS